jgi:hypothetical protein
LKIRKIKGFTSSYDNEIDLIVDIIMKLNEMIRKLNMIIEQGGFIDTSREDL